MTELVNRNVVINGKRSSMRLEQELWELFRELCEQDNVDHVEMMKRALTNHSGGSHTSTVRMYLFSRARNKVDA